MSDTQSLVEVFRVLARRLSNLPDNDVADLLSGDATLDIRVKRRGGKKGSSGTRPIVAIAEAAKHLQTMRSRDAGLSYLEELSTPRAWLEDLARVLDLPVQRSDSVERLRSKIIEGTIGYRLRSQAVHGREAEQLPLEQTQDDPPEIGKPSQDSRVSRSSPRLDSK